MNRLAPSILSADFWILGEQIRELGAAGVDFLHIDVMDGAFVPSISFGIPVVKTIREKTDMFFDCHLMVNEPDRYVEAFADAGADSITVHAEACSDLEGTLAHIRSLGKGCGVSVNPETPISVLEGVLDKVDMVLVMSVHPGFGGQKFIEASLEKIRQLRMRLDELGLKTDIEVDGGINAENVQAVIEAGANIIVSGNSVFKGDITANVGRFRHLIGE